MFSFVVISAEGRMNVTILELSMRGIKPGFSGSTNNPSIDIDEIMGKNGLIK